MFHFGHPIPQAISILEFCIIHDFPAGLQILLRGCYINTRRALEEALTQVNEACIKILLDNCLMHQRGCTESLFALLNHGYIVAANSFVQRRGFNVKDSNLMVPGSCVKSNRGRAGQTCLHVAAIFSSMSVTQHLLLQGVDPNVRDAEGYSSLFIACANGNFNYSRNLLQVGVETDTINRPNQLPCSCLFAVCHLSNTSAIADNEKLVKMLLWSGLDLTKESWINLPPAQTLMKYVSDETYDKLQRTQRMPLQLFYLCIRKIRTCVAQAS